MTSVRDIIIVAVLLFAIGVTLMFVVKVGHSVNSNLLTLPVMNSSGDAVTVINSADAAINSTDYIYLALFLGFFFSILITGYFVGGTPIMASIYFFVVVIFSFVGVILQLVWDDLSVREQLLSSVVNLPITHFILSNLGYFVAIFGLAGIFAMFAKPAEAT